MKSDTFFRRCWGRLMGGTLVVLAAAIVLGGTTAEAAWQPRKPVELIIMAGPGGGADQLARFFQGIIQQSHLANMPLIPINKPGGAGAEALRYLKDKAGDPHVVMITLNSYYTTPLRTDIGVDIADFTPIARMAMDTFILWVNVDTPAKTVDEYMSLVRKAGGTWKMGGTGTGQEDSLVTALLEQEYGVKFTYVPFPGGGTVAKNLAGKHIDSTVNNPAEQLGFYEAGKTRPLATLTPERQGFLPDVPTFRELGHDLVYYMQRSIVGPPNMPEEAQAYYTSLFRKVNDHPKWVKLAEEEGLTRAFISGDELQQFFLHERATHEKLLRGMGEIK